MREAMFYEKKESRVVTCLLCPKRCVIREDNTGFCRVRVNRDGRLYASNYGQVTSYGLDPIEKKPLYHFYPGAMIMSFGTVGCNMRCSFCQNWTIAHGTPEIVAVTPEKAVDTACQMRRKNSVGIAYTYSEPMVWYEFVLGTARLAKRAGLKNVLVTNGYTNETPLRELLPYIDAMNIDVKGFTENYYKNQCAGSLDPVLRTVELAYAQKCHVELTTLLVTGLNDSVEEIQQLIDWVAALDREIPLHLSRYFPNFERNLPATPLETLRLAESIARDKLSYVYVGNAPELSVQDTRCPRCGSLLISRNGCHIHLDNLKSKTCSNCGKEVNIILANDSL